MGRELSLSSSSFANNVTALESSNVGYAYLLLQIGRIAKRANVRIMKCHVQNYPTI